MNTAYENKRLGLVAYAVATICLLTGIVMNFQGSVGVGGGFIGFGLVLCVATALRLGHLKKW